METRTYRILSINPGSTSTKIGVFDGDECVFEQSISHSTEELSHFHTIMEQREMRLATIDRVLSERAIAPESIDAFVGRGGILKPMLSGVYEVTDEMLRDLTCGKAALHASALGGIFARAYGDRYGKPSYIVDPVVVDERDEVAKVTGIPGAPRTSVFHALNQKSVARAYAKSVGKRYDECCVVVAHLGGGISIGAHEFGRVIDVTNAIDGDGPLSPERCGAVEVTKVVEMCFSGEHTRQQMLDYATKKGGFVAHLGTTDCREVERRIACGDQKAALVFEAMGYGVAKHIAAMAAALKGRAEAIIITGGMARSELLMSNIRAHVEFIAPVVVYPGEDELKALAEGGLRVLSGREQPRTY
ncbi:MAG: butyrate kinase [Clostridia bacterium]|nr:butyrate kinase [Clostridia bacterium]